MKGLEEVLDLRETFMLKLMFGYVRNELATTALLQCSTFYAMYCSSGR